MTAAAHLASLLLEHFGVTGKPDLLEICNRLGLRVKEVPLTGAHGALVRSRSAGKGIISVRSSLPEQTQKRFTIAHEIGHFVIPYHANLGNVCDSSALGRFNRNLPKPELEANEFAAEMLLPAKFVRVPMKLNEPSLKTISRVATEFEASLTSATWRFLDLTDQPCAMVWTHKGSAVWYRTSDALPYDLPLKEVPAPSSLAAQLSSTCTSRANIVDPHLWFNPQNAETIQTLFEDSLYLPRYESALTLLWAKKLTISNQDQDELLSDLRPEDFSLNRSRWPR